MKNSVSEIFTSISTKYQEDSFKVSRVFEIPEVLMRNNLQYLGEKMTAYPKVWIASFIIFLLLLTMTTSLKRNNIKFEDTSKSFNPVGTKLSDNNNRFKRDSRRMSKKKVSVSNNGKSKGPELQILVSEFNLVTYRHVKETIILFGAICEYFLYKFSIKYSKKSVSLRDLCHRNPSVSACENNCNKFLKPLPFLRKWDKYIEPKLPDDIIDMNFDPRIFNYYHFKKIKRADLDTVIRHRIFLFTFKTYVNSSESKEMATKWCIKGVEAAKKFSINNTKFAISGFSQPYSKIEETALLMQTIPKFIIVFVGMITMAVSISFNWTHRQFSRSSLAIAATLMSIFAVIAAIDLGILFNIPLYIFIVVIPFIILGIGLDSSFLIVHGALNILKNNSAKTSKDFIIQTVDNCFMSVTMSDLTAILSFTVGSFTPFLAVNSVCRYLALSVVCLWFAELFFFIPCLALKFQSHFKESNRERLQEMDKNVFNAYENYVNFLISLPANAGLKVQLFVKLFFILLFVGTLSFSIYSLINMRKFANNLEAHSDDSIIKNYRKVALDAAVGYYFSTHLVFNKRLNLSDSSVLKQVQLAGNYISSSPIFTASESIKWLIKLSKLTNISDISNYISDLKNNQFVDVKEINDSYILMPRIYVTYRYNPLSGNIEEESKVIKAIFEFEDKFYGKLGSYFYDVKFSVMECDSLLVHLVWKSLFIAFACCMVTVAIFIPNIWVLMTVVFLTASTTIMVLGLMAALGMTYSTSTYLMMLLAVGLCIDYMAHSGRFFFTVPVTHSNRCLVTQLDVGVPLFNAALSSFIGISALLFGNSPAIRIISKCLAIVFLVSFLNSVFVLPYLLTLRDTIKSLIKEYKPTSDA